MNNATLQLCLTKTVFFQLQFSVASMINHDDGIYHGYVGTEQGVVSGLQLLSIGCYFLELHPQICALIRGRSTS